jgi:hypothetical protein
LKYDDASWHYGGDFPEDLNPESGGTHIGMFVAWAMLNGLAGALHTDDFPDELEELRKRTTRPGSWFIKACDGKFTDEDLNNEGNAFALAYYANDDGLQTQAGSYLADYELTFTRLKSLYHVADTWTSYDELAPLISRRFLEWHKSNER